MIGGAYNAPAGYSRRLMGGVIRVKERAPRLGGQFAAWGLCFSSFDCTFAHMRGKEDPWNRWGAARPHYKLNSLN